MAQFREGDRVRVSATSGPEGTPEYILGRMAVVEALLEAQPEDAGRPQVYRVRVDRFEVWEPGMRRHHNLSEHVLEPGE